MSLTQSLRMALKSLASSKLRSLLTMLGNHHRRRLRHHFGIRDAGNVQ